MAAALAGAPTGSSAAATTLVGREPLAERAGASAPARRGAGRTGALARRSAAGRPGVLSRRWFLNQSQLQTRRGWHPRNFLFFPPTQPYYNHVRHNEDRGLCRRHDHGERYTDAATAICSRPALATQRYRGEHCGYRLAP